MPYKLNDQQMQSVLRLDGPARYEHFVKRVADWQEVWALKAPDGFVGMGDDAGNNGIPFWPHPRYAEQHAADDWASCQATLIPLADFMEKWLPGMAQDGVKVIIFPTPQMKGLVLDPAVVRDDLQAELAQYE